jgi:hypothetical protein
MSEIKFDPTFENSPEDKDIMRELGIEDFGEMSLEDLEELYKSKEQEYHIASDVNGAYTSEDQRTSLSKELTNIQRVINSRKDEKINDTPRDGGEFVN